MTGEEKREKKTIGILVEVPILFVVYRFTSILVPVCATGSGITHQDTFGKNGKATTVTLARSTPEEFPILSQHGRQSRQGLSPSLKSPAIDHVAGTFLQARHRAGKGGVI